MNSVFLIVKLDMGIENSRHKIYLFAISALTVYCYVLNLYSQVDKLIGNIRIAKTSLLVPVRNSIDFEILSYTSVLSICILFTSIVYFCVARKNIFTISIIVLANILFYFISTDIVERLYNLWT